MMNSRWRNLLLAGGCLVVCFLPGVFGGRFVPGVWYQGLAKPALTPPGWLFPVAWTALYVMMGVSLFIVLRKTAGSATPKAALSAFALQLLLNGLWSWIFFGLHMPALAFAEIVFLWLAIGISAVHFWHIKRAAGLLLLPYLGWVTFAAWLNFSLWRLNL